MTLDILPHIRHVAHYATSADGKIRLVRILRARKTGEATIRCATGKTAEYDILAASEVIAIIP